MPTGLFSEIASLTLEHLELVVVAMLIAAAIAIPTGIFLTRRAGMRSNPRVRSLCRPRPDLARRSC